MTEPQQRCGTCRWFGKNPRFIYGSCEWPVEMPISLPDCLNHQQMMPDEGTTCPTWALRQEEQP